ncbi:MAG: hypothetical protein R3E42_01360 [Burkholderiaceae bacterium]
MAYSTPIPPSRTALPEAPEAPALRRAHPVLPWPEELLIRFSLCMSSHGMSISRIDMLHDPQYAFQQLQDAQAMGDPTLALIADALFRCFEAHQSGLPSRRH